MKNRKPTKKLTLIKNDVLKKIFTIFIGLCLSTSIVYGQTLEDFEKAANSSKLDCIPYNDMHNKAKELNNDVQNAKLVLSYDQLNNEKKKILKDIEDLNKEIKAKQDEIDIIKRKNGYITDLEKEKVELEKKLKAKQEDLEDFKKRCNKAMEDVNKLVDARKKLYDYCEKVIAKLKIDKNEPEKYLGNEYTTQEETKFKDAITKSINKINDENETHKTAREDLVKLAEKYKQLAN